MNYLSENSVKVKTQSVSKKAKRWTKRASYICFHSISCGSITLSSATGSSKMFIIHSRRLKKRYCFYHWQKDNPKVYRFLTPILCSLFSFSWPITIFSFFNWNLKKKHQIITPTYTFIWKVVVLYYLLSSLLCLMDNEFDSINGSIFCVNNYILFSFTLVHRNGWIYVIISMQNKKRGRLAIFSFWNG